MEPINRRLFLIRSSMAAAAAGVATAIPLTPALLASETEAPAAGAAVDEASSDASEPLVAHVRDLATGEIGLYSGTREITFRDPGLASRLFHASH